MRAFAVMLAAGLLGSSALAQPAPSTTPGPSTTIVPRTTITIDERPAVVQPGPVLMGPATPPPDARRRARTPVVETYGPPPPPRPAAADRPPPPRAQGPRRPSNGYSSFLTGPIDLTRPPVPQQ